jgi:hypothetical protein
MNEIERRTLLGAAGIGAVAALSKAGPLTPPAGSIAPTGRTTEEIYNKIPPIGGSDGRTPIDTGPFTIASPGSYVLTGNLSGSANVLVIVADDVTVDLNGFTITSTSTTAAAVVINGTLENITVRNGNVFGGLIGINVVGLTTGVLIEDVRVSSAKTGGIVMGNSIARDCVIRRCEISNTGVTTTAADGSLGISGITITGHSCRIEDCTIARMFYNGSGTPTIRGINLNSLTATGNIVSRCTLSHDGAITGNGVAFLGAATAGVYRDCTVTNFSIPYSGGTNGGGNV